MSSLWIPGKSPVGIAAKHPEYLAKWKWPRHAKRKIALPLRRCIYYVGGEYQLYDQVDGVRNAVVSGMSLQGDALYAETEATYTWSESIPAVLKFSVFFDLRIDPSAVGLVTLFRSGGLANGLLMEYRTGTPRFDFNFSGSGIAEKITTQNFALGHRFRIGWTFDGSLMTIIVHDLDNGAYEEITATGSPNASSTNVFSLGSSAEDPVYFYGFLVSYFDDTSVPILRDFVRGKQVLFNPANQSPFLISVPAAGGTPTLSSPGVINVQSDRATPQVTLTF